jgi:hypothetical protein
LEKSIEGPETKCDGKIGQRMSDSIMPQGFGADITAETQRRGEENKTRMEDRRWRMERSFFAILDPPSSILAFLLCVSAPPR